MKVNYNLNIIGNNDMKKVLLIHGVGFNYENCFNKIINKLKKILHYITRITRAWK